MKIFSLRMGIGIFCMVMFMNSSHSDEYFDLKKLPKAELHLHLSGSYPKSYLFSIATEEQKQKLENALTQIRKSVDYHEVFHVFQLVNQIIDTEEKVQKGVEALCLALKEDGVVYAEIRSGLKNLGEGPEAYLQAILEGMKNSAHIQAKLLLSLQRNSSLTTVRETIDLALKYQDRGVIGIDISGDSTIGQIDLILPDLLRAKNGGLPFVIHIGESPEEKDQMLLLTTLNPVRIGHGVHLSSEASNWILSNRIPLEVCLSSSLLVQMIERYDQHPGVQFYRGGHPIVFCTDDPLLFSTSLSQELMLAYKEAGLLKEEVEQIARDSLLYKIVD